MESRRRLKLLIDTNIVLEVLLNQSHAKEAETLLTRIEAHDLFLSDYALHSIGNVLFRQKKYSVYHDFISDLITDAGIQLLSLAETEHSLIENVAQKFNLDFDDAYQYVLAEKYDLILVSFDKDFDRTERGRKTPAAVLHK